jgi:hypothetical protein
MMKQKYIKNETWHTVLLKLPKEEILVSYLEKKLMI